MAGKTGKSPGAAGKRRSASERAAPAGGAAARAALRRRGARGTTVEARRAKGGIWLRVEAPLEAAAALLGE